MRLADVGQISAIRITTPSGKDLRRSIGDNERRQYQSDKKIKAQPWTKRRTTEGGKSAKGGRQHAQSAWKKY